MRRGPAGDHASAASRDYLLYCGPMEAALATVGGSAASARSRTCGDRRTGPVAWPPRSTWAWTYVGVPRQG
jgi:hypothetical protein